MPDGTRMNTHAAKLISSAIVLAGGAIAFAIGSFNNKEESQFVGFLLLIGGASFFLKTWFAKPDNHTSE